MNKRTLILAAVVVTVVAVSLGFWWPFSGDRHTLKIPGTVEVQEIRLGSKVGGRFSRLRRVKSANCLPTSLMTCSSAFRCL